MQSHGINIGGTVTIQVGLRGHRPVNTLVFPANPDQVKSINARTTIVQTLTGIYVDRFGPGIQTLNLSGTTAWSSPIGRFNGQHVDGNTAAKHLYRDIWYFYESHVIENSNYVMEIYNDVTGEAWVVEPIDEPRFQRTGSSPLVEYFSMDFVILQDLMTGHQIQKTADPIVNTFSSTKSITQYASNKVTTAKNQALSVKRSPYVIRTVQAGDTLWSIAQSYLPKQAGSSDVQAFVDKIASLNGISNVNLIFTGMKLKIPA
ncbi:MAG: LysM peptidoglycan-binding domain-containing protein [Alicyclobacillus sp.]|nr:LysM peptidoglycan-binding domain-containing protein [Alicyclobacillus sp.]